jgi:hypothetical protein
MPERPAQDVYLITWRLLDEGERFVLQHQFRTPAGAYDQLPDQVFRTLEEARWAVPEGCTPLYSEPPGAPLMEGWAWYAPQP